MSMHVTPRSCSRPRVTGSSPERSRSMLIDGQVERCPRDQPVLLRHLAASGEMDQSTISGVSVTWKACFHAGVILCREKRGSPFFRLTQGRPGMPYRGRCFAGGGSGPSRLRGHGLRGGVVPENNV